MQGSYKVLLKRTCAFLCVFFIVIVFFSAEIFRKHFLVLFFLKNVLFFLNCPYVLGLCPFKCTFGETLSSH